MSKDSATRKGVSAQALFEETAWSRGMIRIARHGATALLLLDRPEKLNAMGRSFWGDLRSAVDWVGEHSDLGAIVITGSPTAFSVGGDVASFASLTTSEARHEFQIDAMASFDAVASSPVPVIAAVNGYALGGGCELAMAADIVLAGKTAQFGLPEVRFGLVPGYGVLRAPKLVGDQMAMLMILAGERLDAEEALKCGLVQKVYEDERLLGEALRIAAAIGKASRHAVGVSKDLIRKSLRTAEVNRSIEAISGLHGTQESRVAVSKFLEG